MPMTVKSISWSKLCVGFLIYMCAMLTITSRFIWPLFNLPHIVNQVLIVLEYLPFAGFALWKLVIDIKSKKLDIFSKFYYAFGGYYIVLSGVRLVLGMEVKDNLYIACVLFGTLALYFVLYTKKAQNNQQSLFNAILLFSVVLVIY